MKPILLEAYDNMGKSIFSYSVPFHFRENVQSLLDRTFVGNQSPTAPDPFAFTLEYFGYSQSPQFPGYLGYEIESLGSQYPTDKSHYWSLSVNGHPSDHGIDTTYPGPGDKVTFRYQSTATAGSGRNAREREIVARRAARAS